MKYFQVTDTVDIYRLNSADDKEQYGQVPTHTGLKVTLVPAGNDILTAFPGDAVYSLYQMVVYDDVNMQNGDKVVSGTGTYYVRGVPRVVNIPYIYHQEILVEKVVGV